ncbi:hypothetical protein KM043_012088 [Ampulex compressa]|nr:hypothetical protein KM043_012088 [Ampulex compressa]
MQESELQGKLETTANGVVKTQKTLAGSSFNSDQTIDGTNGTGTESISTARRKSIVNNPRRLVKLYARRRRRDRIAARLRPGIQSDCISRKPGELFSSTRRPAVPRKRARLFYEKPPRLLVT